MPLLIVLNLRNLMAMLPLLVSPKLEGSISISILFSPPFLCLIIVCFLWFLRVWCWKWLINQWMHVWFCYEFLNLGLFFVVVNLNILSLFVSFWFWPFFGYCFSFVLLLLTIANQRWRFFPTFFSAFSCFSYWVFLSLSPKLDAGLRCSFANLLFFRSIWCSSSGFLVKMFQNEF